MRIQRKGASKINIIKTMTSNLKIEMAEYEEFICYFDRSLKVSLARMNCFRFKKIKTIAKIIRSKRKMIAPAEAFEMLYP